MMRRFLIIIIASALILGCAQKPTAVKSPQVQKQPTVTPVKVTPTKRPTENTTTPEIIPTDINKTLTDINELMKDLQEIENVSFNL